MSQHFDYGRRYFLGATALTIAASAFGKAAAERRLPVEGKLPSLNGATEWLSSQPLTPMALRGKVVLIDFWTYSCINWRRTLPYLREWAQKYKEGLVVIGVHTPEFGFEKDIQNVRQATKQMEIGYPVAIDSGREIWKAFNNEYWPALYFVDARGRIRHHQFGEGRYERSELVIQELLAESGLNHLSGELVNIEARGVEAAADWENLNSPETYIGYARTENFASPGGIVSDKQRAYDQPSRIKLNQWALSGNWTVRKEAAVLNEAQGCLAYCFHARDLHMVMGPVTRGTCVRFRVLLDGQPPMAAHGVDVDEHGNGTITEQRLYQLIRQPHPIVDKRFEIRFFDAGVEAFSFTFG